MRLHVGCVVGEEALHEALRRPERVVLRGLPGEGHAEPARGDVAAAQVCCLARPFGRLAVLGGGCSGVVGVLGRGIGVVLGSRGLVALGDQGSKGDEREVEMGHVDQSSLRPVLTVRARNR